MALQAQTSLSLREKRILVTIDVAVRKMENLSMISTLCHHFSVARTTSRNCWLEKLNGVLGKESVDVLEELVSCQKKYNQLLGYPVGVKGAHCNLMEGVTHAERKKDLSEKFSRNPEKRRFLQNVMTAAKIFLIKDVVACNSDDNITVENGVDTIQPSSVVSILRAALQSKYRQHVLRCFTDMDLESLMNILFLMLPSSSLSEKHLETDDYFPLDTSKVDGTYKTRIDSTESSTSLEGSAHSIFWDDEETVINVVENLNDNESIFPDETKLVEAVSLKEQKVANSGRQFSVKLGENFGTAMLPYSIPTHIKDVVVEAEQSDISFELHVLDTYKKLVDLFSVSNIDATIDKLTTDFIYSDDGLSKTNMTIDTSYSGIPNFLQVFHSLRSLVLSIFTRNKSKSGVRGLQNFNRMMTYLQLLSTDEDKLRKELHRIVETHKDLQGQLDDTITIWKREVYEAKCQLDQQLRNSIKDYVAAEISIGKSRAKELSNCKLDLENTNGLLTQTTTFVRQTVKSLRARRHYLEASLESLVRQYDTTMLKYQAKIDELSVEEVANNREIERLQNKFKHVEENYDEMRAMKRLKQLLQNMEKAEAIKQNWAARKIQVAWRKYKVAKLRKKKLKGRRKGKKKTPPPGKGGSPATKSSTPGSRSKSQTP